MARTNARKHYDLLANRWLLTNLAWTLILSAATTFLFQSHQLPRLEMVVAAVLAVVAVIILWLQRFLITGFEWLLVTFLRARRTAPEPIRGSPQELTRIAVAVVEGLRITINLWLVALVVLNLVFLRGSPIGEHLAQAGYNVVREVRRTVRSAKKIDSPVVVVDTSNIGLIPASHAMSGSRNGKGDVPGPADERTFVTDRAPLRAFLELAASAKNPPKAVGIDINFHNSEGGFLNPDDYKFFDFCLHSSKKSDGQTSGGHSLPRIYLGVDSTEGLPPERWLAMPDYKGLAASMSVLRKDAGHLIAGITKPAGQYPPFLGYALAKLDNDRGIEDPPSWFPFAVISEYEKEDADGRQCRFTAFLVDYSWLDTIKEKKTTVEVYNNDPTKFHDLQGKVVLLGDVEHATIQDAFVVPGESEPVPGVYLHACAAATLLDARLYELRPFCRICADLILAIGVLCWLALMRLRAHDSGKTLGQISLPPAFGLLAVAVVLSGLMLGVFGLFWPDFLVAAVLLAIHPLVEWAWHTFAHKLGHQSET
jgi:hypothetical protein